MQSHILALTNTIPATHFLFLSQCYIHSKTRMQTLLKVLQTFPNNVNSFYDGKLPFHFACEVAAHILILDTLLKRNQNAIKITSKKTNDTALHLYLLSEGNGFSSNTKSFKMTVKFLVKKIIMCCCGKTIMDGYQSMLQLFEMHQSIFCS